MRVFCFLSVHFHLIESESCEFRVMARYNDLSDQMAELDIEEEENAAFVFEGEVEEEVNKYELCLVGRFLTDRSVNVRAMKSKMADIWRPAMGINIKEIEQGIFLFQFYHREDMAWVLKGGPWAFDSAMLVLAEVPNGEEPLNVPLWHIHMWLQIYDLPTGFMSESVGKQLGDFFGEFLEYDHKNNGSIWREYMRIRVRLDVRRPLKRKKKIVKRNGSEVIVSCKYERLGDFCFTCGVMTHTERYCRKFLNRGSVELDKEWGSWLRAQPRRSAGPGKSKWLREDGDTDWEERQGRVKVNAKSKEVNCGNAGNQLAKERKSRPQLEITENESYPLNTENNLTLSKGGKANSNLGDGPEEDELIGLELVERKRMRGGPTSYEHMDTEGGLRMEAGNKPNIVNPDIVLSEMDCATSSPTELARLALQASQAL